MCLSGIRVCHLKVMIVIVGILAVPLKTVCQSLLALQYNLIRTIFRQKLQIRDFWP